MKLKDIVYYKQIETSNTIAYFLCLELKSNNSHFNWIVYKSRVKA